MKSSAAPSTNKTLKIVDAIPFPTWVNSIQGPLPDSKDRFWSTCPCFIKVDNGDVFLSSPYLSKEGLAFVALKSARASKSSPNSGFSQEQLDRFFSNTDRVEGYLERVQSDQHIVNALQRRFQESTQTLKPKNSKTKIQGPSFESMSL